MEIMSQIVIGFGGGLVYRSAPMERDVADEVYDYMDSLMRHRRCSFIGEPYWDGTSAYKGKQGWDNLC